MEIKSLDADDIWLDPALIAKNTKVKELARLISIELKRQIAPSDLILYANGRRLHPNEKGDKSEWPDGLSFMMLPVIPTWTVHFKITSMKLAGRITFPNPESCTIYDLLKKIIQRISLDNNSELRQIKFKSYNSLSPEAHLLEIDNSSPLKVILKTEKQDTLGYLRISINFEDGSLMWICIKPKSKISKLKWILACKGKRVFRLIKNNLLLNDNETIENLGIKDNDLIEGQQGALGGAFRFANLSNEKNVFLKFDAKAPIWRAVKRGISFKSKCSNPKCEASRDGGLILVNKGFGVFNLGETITSLKCPVCKRVAGYAENCGLFDCKWRFRGVKVPKNQEMSTPIISETCEAGRDSYVTFEELGEHWIWIKIEVREKGQEYWMSTKKNWN